MDSCKKIVNSCYAVIKSITLKKLITAKLDIKKRF
jgi:hypothetical protein